MILIYFIVLLRNKIRENLAVTKKKVNKMSKKKNEGN